LGLGQGVANPNWIGRGSNAPAESGYVPASDFVGFDIYPYNNCGGSDPTCGEFWLNAVGISNLKSWSNRNQATMTWIETTQIGSTGNAPTPAQTASEVWLAIIHGANGIGYFVDTWVPSFREDGIFNYPNMVSAVTALNQEIKTLAPEINSASIPNLVSVKSSSSTTIDMMVKANGTSLYIFSATSLNGSATGTFTIDGMSGNGTVDVVNENRTIPVTAGQFSDNFSQNGVHIYKLDLAGATCK
jgi:hypothetical protein